MYLNDNKHHLTAYLKGIKKGENEIKIGKKTVLKKHIRISDKNCLVKTL
jgi:hypothetical protein